MKIDRIIEEFIMHQAGGMVITDEDGQPVYQTESIELTPSLGRQLAKRSADAFSGKRSSKKWEYSHSDSGRFYRVRSSVLEHEGRRFFCSMFTDLSDYASLYKEIADYSRRISDISDFQANLLGKMSESYETCLSDICTFFGSDKAVLYVSGLYSERVIRTCCENGAYQKEELPAMDDTMAFLYATHFDSEEDLECLFSGEAGGRYYAVYVRSVPAAGDHLLSDAPVFNVLRLYIENGLLRERIIYENEHDHLTGLNNKGKYMDLIQTGYFRGCPLSVFYFDVNDLKYVNDTLGHEAGDQLIRIAARSILQVLPKDSLAFRLGGDEFAMICKGMHPEEAAELKLRWKEGLHELNKQEELFDCVIACGFAYGDEHCSPEELIEEADVEMYREKRLLKKLQSPR